MRIMRDKLILLQKLYINQFKRLRYVMAEERRAYRFWNIKLHLKQIFLMLCKLRTIIFITF